MNKVDIYDPALCCSTGVCGPSPDSSLAAFASTLEGVKGQGVSVTRYNLAQAPLAFVENAEVKAILEKDTDSALPLVFINDELTFRGEYPSSEQLAKALGLPSEKPAPMTFVKVDAPKSSPSQDSCCDPSTGCC